jgi:hypothetical protein
MDNIRKNLVKNSLQTSFYCSLLQFILIFLEKVIPVSQSGLPPFAGAKTGQKNIRVPPLIFSKYIFIQI